MIYKLLKCNLVLKRIITTCSGLHLQSLRMILRLSLHSQSEPGSKIILSVLITQNSPVVEFYLLPKLTTFLPTCADVLPMFFLFNTHSFHLPYKYRRFLLGSVRICTYEKQEQQSAWNGKWGEANTVLLSCILIEGGFVGVIEIMVEGAEIRETLPELIDELKIKIPREESLHILKGDYQGRI